MRARKTESKLQKRTRALALELLGVESSKFEGASENGKIDVIFWLPLTWGARGPGLVEFKKPGEVARPLQEHKHKKWEALGYFVGVFDDEYSVIEALCQEMDTPKLPKEGRKILAGALRRIAVARSGVR